ncbi:MAG: twin-arginine translocase TatA/TatE family subunit [Phycisphaerae bacterium]|jgi:sec-independent protein translocase protein TatA
MLGFINFGTQELIIILVIAVLIFGKRLPEIARGVGKSVNEFKAGLSETTDKLNKEIEDSKIVDDIKEVKDKIKDVGKDDYSDGDFTKQASKTKDFT